MDIQARQMPRNSVPGLHISMICVFIALGCISMELFVHWSFPSIEHEFIEFSEFRESDKSLKHGLGLI